jgi:hypothetical protein
VNEIFYFLEADEGIELLEETLGFFYGEWLGGRRREEQKGA